jgi:2,4-dienoyl-CoA reductase (NADPH2)
MSYPRLFSPITIHGMTLKNRLVMPAMHHLYTDNGYCTDRFCQYYWRRAEGGLGLVIVGSCRFDDYGAKDNSMSLRTDDTIPGWQTFTQGMHDRDCKVAVQLYHAGRYMPKKDVPCGGDALSPSATFAGYTRETAPEMTVAQIKQLLVDYADGARRARAAGFDAVEISGSSGYLLCQFLSPLTNLRTDEYGGSFENRCRFPLEVIRAVRAAVGEDYPVIYRLGADDFIPGSNTVKDMVQFAPLAEAAGVDCFNVTGGWHETKVPQLPGDVPVGALDYLGKAIREAVTVPVMMCNRMGDPMAAEQAIALGRADLVGMGRPMLADPDFANKAKEGRTDEIRRCVACNQGCLANTFFDRPIKCLVNGLCGREAEIPEKKTVTPQRVLVVGGGPGGCEAAIRAAQRGHFVTLWEKSDRLGGLLNLTAVLPTRYEFGNLVRYYETMLKKLGVSVELEKAGDYESIHDGGFDRVILATGGVDNVTELPVTADAVPVVTSKAVLRGDAVPGKNVVVIGGSFTGCETAQYLARQGSLSPERLFYMTVFHVLPQAEIETMLNSTDRTVTLVEKGPKVGYGYESGTAWPILQDLDRLGVKRYKSTCVTEINGEGIVATSTARDGTETEVRIPCDTVVVASGVHPCHDLYDRLQTAGVAVSMVGNVNTLGKAIDAIAAAAELGATL